MPYNLSGNGPNYLDVQSSNLQVSEPFFLSFRMPLRMQHSYIGVDNGQPNHVVKPTVAAE